MTFERKVTAAKFGPDELKGLMIVFELARVKIQDAEREMGLRRGLPEEATRVASRCGLDQYQLGIADRMISDFFLTAEEARLT